MVCLAVSLVLDLERQLKNRRVDKPGGRQPQEASDVNKAMRSWAVDEEGNLNSTLLWDAREPMAAGHTQANDKNWEDKLAKGKAHKDGSVKALVSASLLHNMTASPPLTPAELKQEYDRNPHEFTVQIEELKQLMNLFSKTEQLDSEVDYCWAKLTKKSRDGGTKQVLFKLLILNRSVFARCRKQIFFLLRCVKGQNADGSASARTEDPRPDQSDDRVKYGDRAARGTAVFPSALAEPQLPHGKEPEDTWS